jgi:hypothetical protein
MLHSALLKKSALALLGALIAGSACAGDTGLYAGAGVGDASTSFATGGVSFSDSQAGYKGIVGFRLPVLFAAEVNYLDFGTAHGPDSRASTHAVAGYLLYFLPIPVVDIFAKGGYANWHGSGEFAGVSSTFGGGTSGGSFSKNESDLAYGAGAQVGFGKFAVRLDWDRINASRPANKLSLVTAGLTYRIF